MTPIWSVVRPYAPRLVAAGLLAAGAESAGVALMATATWLLVTAAGQPPVAALTVAIVLVRTLAIGRGVLRYIERLTGHDAVLRALTAIRARVFAAVAAAGRPGAAPGGPAAVPGAPGAAPAAASGGSAAAPGTPAATGPVHSGDLLSRLVSDVEAVQDALLRVLVPGAAAVVLGLFALLGAVLLSPAAAVVLAAGLALVGLGLPAVAVRLARRHAARVAPVRGALAADAVDLTQGVADLTAYGGFEAAAARAGARAARLATLESRLGAGRAAVDAAVALAAGLTAVGVLLAATATGVAGPLAAVLVIGTLATVEAVAALVDAARRWVELRAPLARVAAVLGDTPAAPADRASPTGPALAEPGESGGPVTLVARGLRVTYRAGAAPALADLDLTLTPGRRVAVVGPSGAGKSTLLAVLAGRVTPDRGTVTVAAAEPPAAAYPRSHLVGGLLADPYVFHTTVRENLLLGRPGVPPAELAAACAAAGLDGWVARQPAGFDTVVGEDGGQLSGGQRQRLALARALVAAPPVLLLDEPTEGLDPAAADAVLAAVLALAGPQRSVLVVTHRLRALAEAGFDEILVLDGGRVARRGRHAELVAEPGWYREQFLAQELAERVYAEAAVAGSGPR